MRRLNTHSSPASRRQPPASVSVSISIRVCRQFSSALRTRETLARILPGLGPELNVRIEPSLYSFDADALLQRLRDVPDDVASVMLIGHNPAMQELASLLARGGDRLDELRRGFPTAALAELNLGGGSWRELTPGTGRLTRFVVPRELGSA